MRGIYRHAIILCLQEYSESYFKDTWTKYVEFSKISTNLYKCWLIEIWYKVKIKTVWRLNLTVFHSNPSHYFIDGKR
jgi:hypothetical protein